MTGGRSENRRTGIESGTGPGSARDCGLGAELEYVELPIALVLRATLKAITAGVGSGRAGVFDPADERALGPFSVGGDLP